MNTIRGVVQRASASEFETTHTIAALIHQATPLTIATAKLMIAVTTTSNEAGVKAAVSRCRKKSPSRIG